MRRIVISSILSISVLAVGVLFGVRHYSQASTVTAYDADVNHDGRVNILDLSGAAAHYGQSAPLPTPTPSFVPNRAIRGSAIINTDDGSTIRTFPPTSGVIGVSCDGSTVAVFHGAGTTTATIEVVATASGSDLASFTFDNSLGSIAGGPWATFPCDFKNPGGSTAIRDRAIVGFSERGSDGQNYAHIRLIDTTSGAILYQDTGGVLAYQASEVTLNCQQTTLSVSGYAGTFDVRLSDGTIVWSAPPGTSEAFTPTC